jgi:hypothetical protein
MSTQPESSSVAVALDHAEHLLAALAQHAGGTLTIPAAALATAPALVREDRHEDGSITLTVSDLVT